MLIEKLNNLKLTAHKPVIMVIGDLMIDHYITGVSTRLSPEAPVPVVDVKNESNTLGGAGNVVQNLVSLGAAVTIGGVIGNDSAANQIVEMLTNEGVDANCIIKDNTRLTTTKTRILAGSHYLLRIDKEFTTPVSSYIEDELVGSLTACMNDADLILFSDYNKGLFSSSLTQRLIKQAAKLGKKVIIDPKGINYQKYKGAFIIKPNKHELAIAAKTEINSLESLKLAAEIILEQTEAEYLIVTLSEEGMMIFSKNTSITLPVKATEVFDVTGAGDTVLASLAFFLANGFDLEEACELANHAAAVVIRRVGSATTSIDEIITDINESRSRGLMIQ